jgi:hypothetical protein
MMSWTARGLVFKQMESFSIKLLEVYVSPREQATDPQKLSCEENPVSFNNRDALLAAICLLLVYFFNKLLWFFSSE